MMKITVIGCGRWGSFLAWYLDQIGHQVSLYGRSDSAHMQKIIATRSNGMLDFPDSIRMTTTLADCADSEIIVISINTQGVRRLMEELRPLSLEGKIFVLCMKGLETPGGKRLSQIVGEYVGRDNDVAVWIGPGHVQEFYAGIPNCMVIDSDNQAVTEKLINAFSGGLIRFYYGRDLIGNEIGAASKNVIGIAAGMLDALNLSSLKGALMARAPREIARLIRAMGGEELSVYGLCHLGDYEATLFSPHSHNRRFGEAFVRGEAYDALAEGYYTVVALVELSDQYGVDMPICRTVYEILYEGADASAALNRLFSREQKREFY